MSIISFPRPAQPAQIAAPAWTQEQWSQIVDHARNVKLTRQAARRLQKSGQPGRARCLLAVSRTRARIVLRAADDTMAAITGPAL